MDNENIVPDLDERLGDIYRRIRYSAECLECLEGDNQCDLEEIAEFEEQEEFDRFWKNSHVRFNMMKHQIDDLLEATYELGKYWRGEE